MYIDYLETAGQGWVAEVDGEVAAFSYADKQDGSIWALFVSPRYEGQGMAKRLLALATDYLFDLGHDSIRLSTGPDTRADRFYAAQGWTREVPGGALDAREVCYTLRNPQAMPVSSARA
jgi:ribosomal protein S18 acetylase RimI-like enzyme